MNLLVIIAWGLVQLSAEYGQPMCSQPTYVLLASGVRLSKNGRLPHSWNICSKILFKGVEACLSSALESHILRPTRLYPKNARLSIGLQNGPKVAVVIEPTCSAALSHLQKIRAPAGGPEQDPVLAAHDCTLDAFPFRQRALPRQLFAGCDRTGL